MPDKIERKAGKAEIPIIFKKDDIKKGFNKILNILHKMLGEDIKEYREAGSKKIGKVKVQHVLKVRFLDEDKKQKNR